MKIKLTFIEVFYIVFVLMVASIIVLLCSEPRAEEYKPFVWVYNNGNELAVLPQGYTIVEQDEPIEVDIVEDDVLEHALERELLRQEERRNEWMQNEYRDFLRECGVQEGLMRGW